MEGAWLGKYATLWEVLCDSILSPIEKFQNTHGNSEVEAESLVLRYSWFLPFLPNDSWFIHILLFDIHDSLFFFSASTPEWKYPDLNFTAAEYWN